MRSPIEVHWAKPQPRTQADCTVALCVLHLRAVPRAGFSGAEEGCSRVRGLAALPATQAGGRSSSTVTFLRPGTYAIVCGVDAHCQLGQFQVYTVS